MCAFFFVVLFQISANDGALAYLAPAAEPPMGWRSWNTLALDIDEAKIREQAQALTKTHGDRESLATLGYNRIGVDDGWQACGDGLNGSFHDEVTRAPLVNKTRFPDLKKFVAELQGMGLKVDWYMNNCWCSETELATWLSVGGNPDQDVAFLEDMGFDGVKVDGCGPAHNMAIWSRFVVDSKRELLLENCANNGPFKWNTPFMPAELPGWVPATATSDVEDGGFNMYRVSRDIAPQFYSAMRNLHGMKPFLSEFSTPEYDGKWDAGTHGMWAYPDILQVANTAPTGDFHMTPTEWRTHFAAWCISGSPLVLGFDLTNDAAYEAAYPIISNERALAINRLWAGEPGRIIRASQSVFVAKTAEHAIDECEMGDITFCQNVTFNTWELWSKILPDPYTGGLAVLLINLSPESQTLNFSLSHIGVNAAHALAVDVWSNQEVQIDNGTFSQEVASHDSVFLIVSADGSCPWCPGAPGPNHWVVILVMSVVGAILSLVASYFLCWCCPAGSKPARSNSDSPTPRGISLNIPAASEPLVTAS